MASEESDKARTNRKWTSTNTYRDRWEKIFGGKKEDTHEKPVEKLDQPGTDSDGLDNNSERGEGLHPPPAS